LHFHIKDAYIGTGKSVISTHIFPFRSAIKLSAHCSYLSLAGSTAETNVLPAANRSSYYTGFILHSNVSKTRNIIHKATCNPKLHHNAFNIFTTTM